MNNIHICDNTIKCLHFSTDSAAISEPCDAIVFTHEPWAMTHAQVHVKTSGKVQPKDMTDFQSFDF